MRLLYVVLLHLVIPVVLAGLWLKGRRQPEYRARIAERFGRVAAPPQPVAVWVHAVSVGETLAALPLIRALVQRHGRGRVWVTSGTPTGSARVQAALGDQVLHSYIPYDLPWAVRTFLDRVQPRKALIVETEIWPSLYRRLKLRATPLLVVNARLSERSYRNYRKYPRFMRQVLGDVSLVAAQSEPDAQRFRDLGAPAVVCAGNIKFDAQSDAGQVARGRDLRGQLGATRPVWAAVSTHEGEESAALLAHTEIRRRLPEALLILVPRHPQRFEPVAAEVVRAGLGLQRRSSGVLAGDAAVLLGDSMGEMWTYLAAADLAFVGGSLCPVGGHNVLEPAVLGLPVLFGPQMSNFMAARDALLAAGGAIELAGAAELPAAVERLLTDRVLRERMGAAGRAVIEKNRGAVARLLELEAQ